MSEQQPDRIVVGVDFAPSSLAAAAWAVRHLAPGAEVTLVHTRTPTVDALPTAEARRRLRELARSLGVTAPVVVRDGDPAHRLAEEAAARGASLVVVGAHRDHPTPWDRLGTTAERLVRESPVPVLVAAGELRGPPRMLLVPVAAADISERAYDWARRLERRFDPKVAVVHVGDAPRPDDRPGDDRDDRDDRDDADRGAVPAREAPEPSRWRRLLADRPAGRVFTDAVAGDAASGILAEAERFRCGLIVVDDRALSGARRPAADRLLRETARPLLVVPAGEGGARDERPSTD